MDFELPPYLEQIPVNDLFSIVLIILVAWLALRALRKGIDKLVTSGRQGRLAVASLHRLGRYAIILIAFAALVQVFGVSENVWTTLTGLMAMVAIGFVAVWSILSNVMCSMILLIHRPFRVGEYIAINGEDISGKVLEITLLQIHLEMDDGGIAQIPNNLAYQKVIKRYPFGKPETKEAQPEDEGGK